MLALNKMKINSPELDKLVNNIKNILNERPTNLEALKLSLENLLLFLISPENRTDQNCREADLFFCLHEDNKFNWDHLSEEFQLILDDIGMQLHDTVKSPEIARNFESTPEQLLERVKKLSTRG
jgi:hypothetical protein